MSGRPHRAGVQQIVDWLREVEEAETRVIAIRAQLPEIERLEARARELRRLVVESMGSMDVAANHNTGWEGRVIWFLNAIRNASAAESNGEAGKGEVTP